MYGRWWAYYLEARMRQAHAAQSHPLGNAQRRADMALDHADDLWIFLRLALVLGIFFAALAGMLWVIG